MKSEKSEVKTRFKYYYIELVVFLTGIGQVLYLPGRHIPIDTSLCSQSPQVRIYGFVAAGSTPSRANMEDETHTTYRTVGIQANAPQRRKQYLSRIRVKMLITLYIDISSNVFKKINGFSLF